MKPLLPFLLLICASFMGYAQNFFVTNNEGTPYMDGATITATITEDDLSFGEYITTVFLINPTENDIVMNTLRTNIALPEGIRAYVCCLGFCYDDDKFAIEGTIEANKHDDYALHILPKGNFGLCKFKLEFWTEENQTDKFTLYVEIDLINVGVHENSPATVSLSAFPNPAFAHSKINISYTLADRNEGQRLVIRNIAGAAVMSVPLNTCENNLSIDASSLKSGVYFYAIENNNHISIAKKLIIK